MRKSSSRRRGIGGGVAGANGRTLRATAGTNSAASPSRSSSVQRYRNVTADPGRCRRIRARVATSVPAAARRLGVAHRRHAPVTVLATDEACRLVLFCGWCPLASTARASASGTRAPRECSSGRGGLAGRIPVGLAASSASRRLPPWTFATPSARQAPH